MKKVDAAGSQRISNEFIGSGSIRRVPSIVEVAPPVLESPLKPRRPLSARGRAGQALVEEVVLGVLDSVSQLPVCGSQLTRRLRRMNMTPKLPRL